MNRDIVEKLDTLIAQECQLYDQYMKTLEQERQALKSSQNKRIVELTTQRQILFEHMKEAEQVRNTFVGEIAGTKGDQSRKLSEFVKANFSPNDSKRLLKRVETLKALVSRCHRESSEFSQVVGFSLNMVSSLISIFWSATQTVVKSYTPAGTVKESFTPARSKTVGLLREA